MPAGVSARRERPPPCGRAARARGLPRPAHRPAEPGDVPGARAARRHARGGLRQRRRRAARRPGRLQARERQLRSRRGRRARARGGPAPGGDGGGPADAVSRLGGDEFAILLPDLDPGRGGAGTGLAADALAERIRAALREPAELAGTEIYCSASVGISLYPADASDPMNLLKHADTALHQGKASGRDAQRRYTHASGDALEQLAMAGRLRRAIVEEQPAAALPAAGRPEDRRASSASRRSCAGRTASDS